MGRLYDSLRDFGARFSDIDAIHLQALAAQRAQAKSTWWKRLLPSFFRRFTEDSGGILSFMASLEEHDVIEVTADALGATLPAHCSFEAHQRAQISTAVKGLQRNHTRPSSRRSPADQRETAAASANEQRPTSAHDARAAAARRPGARQKDRH